MLFVELERIAGLCPQPIEFVFVNDGSLETVRGK